MGKNKKERSMNIKLVKCKLIKIANRDNEAKEL